MATVLRRMLSTMMSSSGGTHLKQISEITRVLTIKGENGIRYNVSYTCAYDTPLAVEYMIQDHIGLTDVKVFQEFVKYYELVVNRNVNRVYLKNYNVQLRFVDITY
jgi:hypothetical protein